LKWEVQSPCGPKQCRDGEVNRNTMCWQRYRVCKAFNQDCTFITPRKVEGKPDINKENNELILLMNTIRNDKVLP